MLPPRCSRAPWLRASLISESLLARAAHGLRRERPAGSKPALAFIRPLAFLVLTTVSLGVSRAGEVALPWAPSSPHQALVEQAVADTLRRFTNATLRPDHMALTLVDLSDRSQPRGASYRGEVQVYPASVIKLFYLVAVHQWLEDGRLTDTDELRRAMRDMIVESYNEATHYLVDLLTDTTSGPELPPEALRVWFDKRNAVNRYFSGRGYARINVNKKPWCEGPYGRESQAIRTFEPKRNWLTTDATARLLVEIATGRAVSPERSTQMLALMKRELTKTGGDPDDQARFTGPALPAGARLWSKAGWTSETRHDATYLELPDGRSLVLVMFTTDHANQREILPYLAHQLLAGLPPRP